ncbi:hypothetical protein VSH64_03250 [Amycolatopsis rhabdoformis]|uniref:GNAT family N-acetyltransferase n=1 Tax=Amycolatopsis rhabdoformis TaxID=1448059 RepID=A0ABZ1ICG9_9PSEU|nr:hypothetical protein [Amycolatopsis rhabdoformis]WSE31135.1 hypothetical protein VSH64_03250 [Amycolatopsis rhabdoformis]
MRGTSANRAEGRHYPHRANIEHMFDESPKRRSGARSEFGPEDVAVRPALWHELRPAGNLVIHAPTSCPRQHTVAEHGSFSWITALQLHSLHYQRCETDGQRVHQWAVIDPAYEQKSPDEADGQGLQLVARPPVAGSPGRIELHLSSQPIGVATMTVCPLDRTGVLEHVHVEPEYRRRGTVERITDRAERRPPEPSPGGSGPVSDRSRPHRTEQV